MLNSILTVNRGGTDIVFSYLSIWRPEDKEETPMIKVMIVDDEPYIRQALRF